MLGASHVLAAGAPGMVAAMPGLVAYQHDLVAGKLAVEQPGVEANLALSGGAGLSI